jgi:ADP-ribosylglycohydrolase
MRVSAIGWLVDGLEGVLREARLSAAVTHDHPEGLLSAQVMAGSISVLRRGATNRELRELVEDRLGHPLERDLAWWREQPGFSSRAIRTLPVAFAAFFEAGDFETTLRLAISAGGDSDTIASMAAALAAARWGTPPAWWARSGSNCRRQ